MENRKEKRMENEVDTGTIFCRDCSYMRFTPTPKNPSISPVEDTVVPSREVDDILLVGMVSYK